MASIKLLIVILCGMFLLCRQTSAQVIMAHDGTNIAYQSYGSGDTTLLFAHGSYIDQTYWTNQVGYFKSQFRVVTLDFPGHGKSGRNRTEWSLKGYAGDVGAVIGKLNLKNVILIGHSAAAHINLMAAKENNTSIVGFIAIDIFKNVGVPLPPDAKTAVLENIKKDFSGTNEQYVRNALITKNTPLKIASKVIADYRNAYSPMGIQIMPEILTLHEVEKELLPQLRLKLHLINVNYFPTNKSLLNAYAAKGYVLMEMQGSSHFPMIENPNDLNKNLSIAIERIVNKN